MSFSCSPTTICLLRQQSLSHGGRTPDALPQDTMGVVVISVTSSGPCEVPRPEEGSVGGVRTREEGREVGAVPQ